MSVRPNYGALPCKPTQVIAIKHVVSSKIASTITATPNAVPTFFYTDSIHFTQRDVVRPHLCKIFNVLSRIMSLMTLRP